MTVGELRKAIEEYEDDVEVVVRCNDRVGELCGADVERLKEDSSALVLDADIEDDDQDY